MSYNKLKSLVANVEAIETAMKIQVQGRQATAEEKEILSRYSGFGGIKEVLYSSKCYNTKMLFLVK